MKTLIITISLLFFTVGINLVKAQQIVQNTNEPGFCGSHEWLETQFKANPGLKIQYEKMEQNLGAVVSTRMKKSGNKLMDASNPGAVVEEFGVVYIPVVFHIVTGNPASITDAQIYAQLDTLNKDFGGYNGDSVKILPGFKPLYGKSNIRFCLAQRTPGGAATNGIMRYSSAILSTGPGATNDVIKSNAAGGADAWDPTKYLNVWVGSFMVSSLLGYASFPITSPENPSGLLNQQGLVIEKSTIPGGTLANYNNGRILTHEAGHYFWLRHIWGDAACGDDFPNTPGIDDTPTAAGPSSGCTSGIWPTGCADADPNGRMFQNYMDYSYSTCMTMFSIGQTIRMAACVDSFRTSLKGSNGCQPVTCPSIDVLVNNISTSEVSITTSGGVAPYRYSLDSVYYQTSNHFTSLISGNTYTVYVRDSMFCTGKKTFVASGIELSAASFYCVGENISISYQVSNNFNNGNQFNLQLSDTSGSFNAPVDIGNISTVSSGTINGIIPPGTLPGKNYQFRIKASDPVVVSNTGNSFFEIANTSVAAAVSIELIEGTNPGCQGSMLTFKANTVNAGKNPSFQWKLNGINVATGPIYSSSGFVTNDQLSCEMISNSLCVQTNTATSDTVTIQRVDFITPSITIVSNKTDSICSGTRVVFTAIFSNGGIAPKFQWKINGVNVGTNSDTFSISSLNSSDTVYCEFISDISCASPALLISNSINFHVTASILPVVTVTSNMGTGVCPGSNVTFTANVVNGGVNPTLQWKKNGVNVGTNSSTFSSSELVNGDTIICELTRSTPATCLSAFKVYSNPFKIAFLNCGTQLLSGNAFLKSDHVELAIGSCGVFASSVNAPGGFHPRGGTASPQHLSLVADVDKTNWNNFVGDYFLPGTPEEGFGISANGYGYVNNWKCSVSGISGSIIEVKSDEGQKSATWKGTQGGLSIVARTFIPAGASYVVTKVTITNISAIPVSEVYYMRIANPDQGALTPGSTGMLNTYNSIKYQIPNACNRTLVSATTDNNGGHYIGFASTDSRAKVAVGGSYGKSAWEFWNGYGVLHAADNRYGDESISIAFNLGTLSANESTSFTYAYVLDEAEVEQALSSTGAELNVNGIKADLAKPVDVCLGSTVNLSIANAVHYSNWSWSPAIGLDTTAGTTVHASVDSTITYTATGTGTCGTITVPVVLNPVSATAAGNAGSIVGNSNPTAGQASVKYSIPAVANATSYSWNLPEGFIHNSKPDSNVIDVRIPVFAVCDSITVTPRNACSQGASSTIAVCNSAPYTVTPGQAAAVCTAIPKILLPVTVTGGANRFLVAWSDSAKAAGFVNISNMYFTTDTLQLSKPIGVVPGTYYGKIAVGVNNIYSKLVKFSIIVNADSVFVPSISIVANTGTKICINTPVVFKAITKNGGTSPKYEWRKNGKIVGVSDSVYMDSNIKHSDSLFCIITSSEACVYPVTVQSNQLKFEVLNGQYPSVVISSSTGGTICNGAIQSFTASISNADAPLLQWKKNGINVGVANIYSPASLNQDDTIQCFLTSNNICHATAMYASNTIAIDAATVTTPMVSGVSNNNCGDSILLTATATTAGNIIYWYDSVGSNIPIGYGDSLVVVSEKSKTYFAEAGNPSNSRNGVQTIADTGAVFISHEQITGPAVRALVIGNGYVYCAGGSYTGKFSKDLATVKKSLQYRVNFFSNLANGELWQFGDKSSAGAFFHYADATRIYKLDQDLNPTGEYLTLSRRVFIAAGFMAAGHGFIIYCDRYNVFYKIDLQTGEVNILNSQPGFIFRLGDWGASYGWAEYDGNNYYVCFVNTAHSIVKRNITTGEEKIIQTYSNLADMANIMFDPFTNRMYYTHQGNSQFGGFNETIGYLPLTARYGMSCRSARVSHAVTVNNSLVTPAVTITANNPNPVCSNALMVFTAFATNGGANPFFQWKKNGVKVATGLIYNENNINNNDIITCELTSSIGCVTTSTVISNTIQIVKSSLLNDVHISSSVTGTICVGSNVLFTAITSNASGTILYEWVKDGVVVGNSRTYNDLVTDTSRLYCSTVTIGPCSNNYTSFPFDVTPKPMATPTIEINSNYGSNICKNTFTTFLASANYGGTNPIYQWKKNGLTVATGSVYNISTLKTGDTMQCYLTSNETCVAPKTVISNAIGITVKDLPVAVAPSNITTCAGSMVPVTNFTGTTSEFSWANNNPAIGLHSTGLGALPAFTAINAGINTQNATIAITPYEDKKEYAYIANSNSNTVSVVDLSNNSIVTNIPVFNGPAYIRASSNKQSVYVIGMDGNTMINSLTNKDLGQFVYRSVIGGFCLSPDEKYFYLGGIYPNAVDIIDIQTNTLLKTLYVGSLNINTLRDVSINADGSKVYAVTEGKIFPFVTASGNAIAAINVGAGSTVMIHKKNAAIGFATNYESSTISVINTQADTVLTTIPVHKPTGIILSKNDSLLYVAGFAAGVVYVYNAETFVLNATIPVGDGPFGFSFNEDGSRLYVTNKNSNSLSVINTTTMAVESTITGFKGPMSVGSFIIKKSGCAGLPSYFTIKVLPQNLNTWTGMMDTDWYNTGNWQCGRIPTATDNVVIATSPMNFYPVIPSNSIITIRSLRLNAGTSTMLGTNANFILTGPN